MSFTPASLEERKEKAISRAVADDTLGGSGAAVKPWESIVGQIAPKYLGM